ncbi:MAG: phage major capsid protein [Patulibacter sp.]
MPTYNSLTDRSAATPLIPEEVANDILQNVPEQSAALTMFRQVRMGRKQQRMPVLSALPIAYFVSGDSGLKQTSQLSWENKYLNAEEIAVIVPVPEAVLDDADFDIWGEAKPKIVEAFGRVLDAAVFFGTNAPATWTDANIAAKAIAAGNTYVRGTKTAAQGGLAGDISAGFSTVETDGYDVNGIVANRLYKGLLRSTRNAQGDKLPEVTQQQWYGEDVSYPLRGLWPTGASAVESIYGDMTAGIIGIRQDITWKVLDQAVITNDSGAVVLNLAQQDSVALRCVFRVGFAVANPINFDNPDSATRYPFGVGQAPA